MIASALNGPLPNLQALPTRLAKPGSPLVAGQAGQVSAKVAATGFPALIQMLLGGWDEGKDEFTVPPDKPQATTAGIVNPLALPGAVVVLPLRLSLPIGNPAKDKRAAEEPNATHTDALNPPAAATILPSVSVLMPNISGILVQPAVQTEAEQQKTSLSIPLRPEPLPEQASAPRVPSAAPPSEILPKFDLAFEAKVTVTPSAKTEAKGTESIKGAAPLAPLTTNTATSSAPDSGSDGQRNSEADTRENASTQKVALKPLAAAIDVPLAEEREPTHETASYPVARETQPNRVPQQQHPESTPVAVASSATIENPAPSAPIRDLSIRLTSSTNEQVDVKIQDKAGELRVAVHSASPELSADLRQQVGELVSKLDRAGFQMEIVKSADHTVSSQPASQGGDGQGREFSGRQQQEQQQAFSRPRKARQAQWMQENANSSNSTAVEGAQQQ